MGLFHSNKGDFIESRQGKHVRPFILDDETCRRRTAQWVCSNATIKGKPNMTAANFCAWVNSSLLSKMELPPRLCPSQIQERTAVKWLPSRF